MGCVIRMPWPPLVPVAAVGEPRGQPPSLRSGQASWCATAVDRRMPAPRSARGLGRERERARRVGEHERSRAQRSGVKALSERATPRLLLDGHEFGLVQ
jgi:hypothetical protein